MIIYQQFRPHEALSPYVDAYWTVSGSNSSPMPDTILPDGCVDIILNYGPSFPAQKGQIMRTGEAWLVGTMTRYKELVRPPATRCTGIRFRPGGFSFFFDHILLRNTADQTVGFDKTLLPALPSDDPTAILNRYLIDRLSIPSRPIQPFIEDIYRSKGRVTVSGLAKQHFMTIRQLERLFQLHLAISPKEFISFVRYQSAASAIRSRKPGATLLDIACACGYYDHAHLSNEIKKYSGSTPLSHSSKLPLTPRSILE
jgi:AraC-like DNA-binding protein